MQESGGFDRPKLGKSLAKTVVFFVMMTTCFNCKRSKVRQKSVKYYQNKIILF